MQIYSGLLGFQEHYNDLLLDGGDSKLCGVFVLQSSKLLYEGSGKRMIEREEGKIGHSCSLSFSNAPLHFKHSSQPYPIPLSQYAHTTVC